MMAPPPPQTVVVGPREDEAEHEHDLVLARDGWGEHGYRERDLLELADQTAIGSIYLRALIAGQLRLSVAVAVAFTVVLCAQPLAAWMWPVYGSTSLYSIPVPWLVLGAASYPLTVFAGYFYVRRAEAIDDEFGDLLE